MSIVGTTTVGMEAVYSSDSKLWHVYVHTNGIRVRCTPDYPLWQEHWDALAKAEFPLYAGDYGCHAYTDVMDRESSSNLSWMWEQATYALESETGWDNYSPAVKLARVANRVARTIATLNFGPEFLIR